MPYIDDRALGVGGNGPSSTANILPLPSTSSVFVPQMTDTSSGGGGGPSAVTKTALEWVFAICALLVISSLFSFRFYQLRRTQRLANTYMTRPSPSRSSQRPPGMFEERPMTQAIDIFMYTGDDRLNTLPRPIPPALIHHENTNSTTNTQGGTRGRRAATGLDIDSAGRRIGSGEDPNGDEIKDDLPAYDNIGGPPKYIDQTILLGDGSITVHELPSDGRMSGESSTGNPQPNNIDVNRFDQAPDYYTPSNEESHVAISVTNHEHETSPPTDRHEAHNQTTASGTHANESSASEGPETQPQ